MVGRICVLPGVIVFAVDYHYGTKFLPPNHGKNDPDQPLKAVKMSGCVFRSNATPDSAGTRHPIPLERGTRFRWNAAPHSAGTRHPIPIEVDT